MKFFEKGDRPLEIVTSRQWYLRNGGRDLDLRADLLALGRELHWHPPTMRVALRHLARRAQRRLAREPPALLRRAVPGLVPRRRRRQPRVRRSARCRPTTTLPVDPSTDCPPGFTEDQRDQPGGFTADPDVMDTWATSSLTPQIATGWVDDPDLFERTFPMDLRPQGPEIIRTWLFDTVVRARLEHGALPWTDTTINGWVLDPDRKKMSKSKGNVVTPMPLVEEYGADALRYWACNGRPGVDTAVDFGVMKVGRKLAIKVLNASKFVLGVSGDAAEDVREVTTALDRSLLVAAGRSGRRGDDGVRRVRLRPLAGTDRAVLLVVLRRLRRAREDARLRRAAARPTRARPRSRCASRSRPLLRLFAPVLPYVSEEVWSWWRDGFDPPRRVARRGAPDRRLRRRRRRSARVPVAADVLAEVRKDEVEAEGLARDAGRRGSCASTPPERLAALERGAPRRVRRGQDRSSSTVEVGRGRARWRSSSAEPPS